MSFFARKIYPILFLLLFSAIAWAQEPARLTLDQAIEYAYERSTAVKNARLAVEDAEQQIIERRAPGLPQLNGDVTYQRYLQVPKQPLPPQFLPPNSDSLDIPTEVSFFLKNNFTAGLTLDAMLFDGSYFVGLKAARTFREYTAEDLLRTKRDVRNSVIEAYLPVLLVDESIELVGKNIANVEKLLYETRALYEEGFAEQLDVDRQQLSLANLEVERQNLVRRHQTAIARLKYVMGFPAEQELEVAATLESLVEVASEANLSEQVNLFKRPEYRLAEQGEQLNELNVRLNKAAYLPTLNAFGAYQYQYQGNDFKTGFWAPQAFVGLRLSIPIFDGLYKSALIQRARLDLERARNDKEDLARAISLEVTNARSTYIQARESLEQQQSNMDLAERIYETTQVKYQEGVGSSVELTQAEQQLYQTQSNFINALYDFLVAKIDLETALGN